MVEVALQPVTAVAFEAAPGPVTAVVGVAIVAVRGEVVVGALGPVTVPLFGTATVTGFTTAGGSFSDRVLASMDSGIRGGGMGTILTMRATLIILIPHLFAASFGCSRVWRCADLPLRVCHHYGIRLSLVQRSSTRCPWLSNCGPGLGGAVRKPARRKRTVAARRWWIER